MRFLTKQLLTFSLYLCNNNNTKNNILTPMTPKWFQSRRSRSTFALYTRPLLMTKTPSKTISPFGNLHDGPIDRPSVVKMHAQRSDMYILKSLRILMYLILGAIMNVVVLNSRIRSFDDNDEKKQTNSN